jgi:flagellar biogenesis protein FliO
MLRKLLSSARQFGTNLQGLRCKRRQRSMRLCETLPLGERRFLALVEVERQKFLLGTAGNSISLLATLSSSADRDCSSRRVDVRPSCQEDAWQRESASAINTEVVTFDAGERESWQ